MRRLLITGAGNAALACIQQLSKLKHHFSILVLGGPRGLDARTGGGAESDQVRLEKLGVEVRADVCVEAIDRYAKVVRGCDGSRTTFDTLILAAESANLGLARAAGLEVRSGVLLNDFLQTSDAHVYALGDGAEHRGTVYSDPVNVQEQARVLAAHVTGCVPAPFKGATTSGLQNLNASIRACAASPAASVGSGLRSGDQTLEPEDQIALAGAV